MAGITKGVTNEELTAAYAAIANGGTYIKPKLYTKVLDHDGNVILDNTAPQSRQVIKETTAWLLTDAMVDVVTSGTGASVNFGNMAIAGKQVPHLITMMSGSPAIHLITLPPSGPVMITMPSSRKETANETLPKSSGVLL